MALTQAELDAARRVLENLKKKHASKTYVFSVPFELSQVPGYLDVNTKVLDLETLTKTLESSSGLAYETMDDFWNDLVTIFENAVRYHTSEKPTSWIAPFAKECLKVVNRERKSVQAKLASASANNANAYNPAAGSGAGSGSGNKGTTTSLKIRVVNKSGLLPTAANKKKKQQAQSQQSSSANTNPGKQLPPGVTTAAAGGGGEEEEDDDDAYVDDDDDDDDSDAAAATRKKPTTTLKLKLGGTTTAASKKKKGAAAAGAKRKAGGGKSESKKPAAKAKTTQTKLKIKLKGPSTSASASDAASSAEPAASATATTQKPKISLKLGGGAGGGGNSRGKELPKGVAAAAASAANKKGKSGKAAAVAAAAAGESSSATTKKGKKGAASTKKEKTVGSAADSSVGGGSSSSSPFPTAQASKILAGLKRRQAKNVTWFQHPVNDKGIIADYKAKIKHPMDLSTMSAKLERGLYHTTQAFALDLRRIFANCLEYNTSIKDSLRPLAVEVLETAEQLLKVFFAGYRSYPPLLYCWKLCVGVLDTLYNLVNPEDGMPTAYWFQHSVSYFCGGQFPPDYLELVEKPMDFATITANLLEAKYKSVDQFSADCRLVISNCITFYSGKEEGRVYIEQANRLNEVLSQQVEQLSRYARSARGKSDSAKAAAPLAFPQPPPPLLLSILEEMRDLTYTDKSTKITEPAMGPFEKPVSVASYPDYPQYVSEPMDLQTIERKIKANAYGTAEDFEYDVNLIFKNCEAYNSKRGLGGQHLVSLARSAGKQFKKLFYAKMRVFEDPVSEPSSLDAGVDSRDAKAGGGPKKITIQAAGITKGKSVPRISLTAAQISSAAINAARATAGGKTMGGTATQKSKASQQQVNIDEPLPLHIAIGRVKDAFPLRRSHKSLQPWETDCARFYKELLRHPWILVANPKFIFHVPVPSLFPSIRESYIAKIRKPMDLTTVECILLTGNLYAGPEDFLQDIALVFANGVRFNKDGRDVGDPFSCAYYDASKHLLRYSRWLSLEILSRYIDEDNDEVDEDGSDGLPPFSWKLTKGNRKRAREEQEKIVYAEPMEKGVDERDSYTWQEAECEKLLKALRLISDSKHMSFFMQPIYPPDYTAFISKPMAWETVQKNLKKRNYDGFDGVIADLRLIFSNALKYNAPHEGTSTVSGQAYESAKIMSVKLEAAISKLLLTVSDKFERERIDHANAEREIEAHERAEEERIREQWKSAAPGSAPSQATSKDLGGSISEVAPSRPDAFRIRVKSRAAQRRESTDLEVPLFHEEDDDQHKFLELMFEKQRHDLTRMRQCANAVGALVYTRLLQRDLAVQWIDQETKKLKKESGAEQQAGKAGDGDAVSSGEKELDKKDEEQNKASTVLSELEREGRGPLQIKLARAGSKSKKGKGTKRKRPVFSFD